MGLYQDVKSGKVKDPTSVAPYSELLNYMEYAYTKLPRESRNVETFMPEMQAALKGQEREYLLFTLEQNDFRPLDAAEVARLDYRWKNKQEYASKILARRSKKYSHAGFDMGKAADTCAALMFERNFRVNVESRETGFADWEGDLETRYSELCRCKIAAVSGYFSDQELSDYVSYFDNGGLLIAKSIACQWRSHGPTVNYQKIKGLRSIGRDGRREKGVEDLDDVLRYMPVPGCFIGDSGIAIEDGESKP